MFIITGVTNVTEGAPNLIYSEVTSTEVELNQNTQADRKFLKRTWCCCDFFLPDQLRVVDISTDHQQYEDKL